MFVIVINVVFILIVTYIIGDAFSESNSSMFLILKKRPIRVCYIIETLIFVVAFITESNFNDIIINNRQADIWILKS